MKVQMSAAVYRGPNSVMVEQMDVPQIQAGEVLVKINRCGVCGTDIKKIQYGLVPPPRIFGHEMAGSIAALGAEVTGWNVGDRVAVMHHVPCMDCYYCRHATFAQCDVYKRTGTTAGFEPAGGGFANYIRVMDWVVKSGMVRIPDHVSDEEATFIEPLNTVLKGVERAGLMEGDTALVMGQGQIGLLFTCCLKSAGVQVLVSDPMQFRREQALKYGSTESFDPNSQVLAQEVKLRTHGRGADVAVVAVADKAVIAQAFDCIRPGGKVLLFAQTRLGDQLEVDAGAICMLEKDLVGSYSADIHLQSVASEQIFNRKVDVRDLVTHRFPLTHISEALDIATRPRDNSLKIMVTLDD